MRAPLGKGPILCLYLYFCLTTARVVKRIDGNGEEASTQTTAQASLAGYSMHLPSNLSERNLHMDIIVPSSANKDGANSLQNMETEDPRGVDTKISSQTITVSIENDNDNNTRTNRTNPMKKAHDDDKGEDDKKIGGSNPFRKINDNDDDSDGDEDEKASTPGLGEIIISSTKTEAVTTIKTEIEDPKSTEEVDLINRRAPRIGLRGMKTSLT